VDRRALAEDGFEVGVGERGRLDRAQALAQRQRP